MSCVLVKKSYIATPQQYAKPMMAAATIRKKMKARPITFAEVFPDKNPQWKDKNIEMSCKTFTDAVLLEPRLRTGYASFLGFNRPSALEDER